MKLKQNLSTSKERAFKGLRKQAENSLIVIEAETSFDEEILPSERELIYDLLRV